MSKILIIEDETKISQILAKRFKADGYIVETASDGKLAASLLELEKYDVIIMDLMLPYIDGWTLIHNLRKKDVKLPVIALTAASSKESIINGLDQGFDDYLPKPFSYEELSARVRALLRRSTNGEINLFVEDLMLDPKLKQVSRHGQEISLTQKEYQLLEYLMRNKGKFIDSSELLEKVWDRNYLGLSNTVAVHIKNLKKKIEKPFIDKPQLIFSERAKGYVIRENKNKAT